MLDIAMDQEAGYLELTIDGPIETQDYRQAVDAVDLLMTRHKKIAVVEVIRTLGWVDPSIWWKDLAFHLTHHGFMRRAAIVSDHGWVGPLTNLVAPFYATEIRTFSLADLQTARDWVRESGHGGAPGAEPHLDFA